MSTPLIDNDAYRAVRSILGDEDASAYAYSVDRVVLALQDHRETVGYRDPAWISSGINPYLRYRGRVPVPHTNTWESLLQWEPGKRSFQAAAHVRHWDSFSPVLVWQNGVQKTLYDADALTGDYTVDYPTGRVTFVYDVDDWEAVSVTFTYFKVYHAARSILLSSLAGDKRVLAEKLGNDSWTYDTIKDKLAAINLLIADLEPGIVRVGRRVY